MGLSGFNFTLNQSNEHISFPLNHHFPMIFPWFSFGFPMVMARYLLFLSLARSLRHLGHRRHHHQRRRRSRFVRRDVAWRPVSCDFVGLNGFLMGFNGHMLGWIDIYIYIIILYLIYFILYYIIYYIILYYIKCYYIILYFY